VASDNPAPALAKPDKVCRKSIEPGRRLAGFRNASATMPGGLCAGLERSWIGGATFAQECNATSPRASAGAGADSLVMSFIAEHTGGLIVEIDLTRIDPVSRTFPFGSDPPRSAPLKVAAQRTAQAMAAEKIDRSRTEVPLCIGLSACVAELGASTSRLCLLAAWHLDAVELEETSVGNHSRHALTVSELRTNVANALHASWSAPERQRAEFASLKNSRLGSNSAGSTNGP
jgi:hypothetical protein